MADRLDVTPLPSGDEKKVVDANVDFREIEPTATGNGKTGLTTTLRSTFGWLWPSSGDTAWAKFLKFFTFLGPGALISVAYIDPDNYQAAIAAGGSFQYKLLFMVLVSNIIAIYLQVCRSSPCSGMVCLLTLG